MPLQLPRGPFLLHAPKSMLDVEVLHLCTCKQTVLPPSRQPAVTLQLCLSRSAVPVRLHSALAKLRVLQVQMTGAYLCCLQAGGAATAIQAAKGVLGGAGAAAPDRSGAPRPVGGPPGAAGEDLATWLYIPIATLAKLL